MKTAAGLRSGGVALPRVLRCVITPPTDFLVDTASPLVGKSIGTLFRILERWIR